MVDGDFGVVKLAMMVMLVILTILVLWGIGWDGRR